MPNHQTAVLQLFRNATARRRMQILSGHDRSRLIGMILMGKEAQEAKASSPPYLPDRSLVRARISFACSAQESAPTLQCNTPKVGKGRELTFIINQELMQRAPARHHR